MGISGKQWRRVAVLHAGACAQTGGRRHYARAGSLMARKASKGAKEEQLPLDLIRTAEVAAIRLEQLSARCEIESPDALPTRHLHLRFGTAATDMEGLDFRVRAEIVATAGTDSGS